MGINLFLKNGYSDRTGITNFKDVAQYRELSRRTRNLLFEYLTNIIQKLNNSTPPALYLGEEINGYNDFVRYLWIDVFSLPINSVPISRGAYWHFEMGELFDYVDLICKNEPYETVFTLLEAIERYTELTDRRGIQDAINEIFASEQVEHQFLNGIITDIISPVEIEEIDEALKQDNVSADHIGKALRFLYDHDKPDYENSVKESIIAVEAMCNIVLGEGSCATLGAALKELESNGVRIHTSLKLGFEKLYGYTCDEDGIRHSGGLDMGTTYEEAKYMIVSCSAFINYLDQLHRN